MKDKELKLVVLDKLPTQTGTEFIIIYHGQGGIDLLDCKTRTVGGNVRCYDKNWNHVSLKKHKILKILAAPHAENRALYTSAGGRHEDWECSLTSSTTGTWYRCDKQPLWLENTSYRHNHKQKQRYILISGWRVPEPIKKPLKIGEIYFYIELMMSEIRQCYWDNDKIDDNLMNAGVIHKNKDSAQKHLDAIIEANNQIAIYLDD